MHRALTAALASTVLATSMVAVAAPAQAAWNSCDLTVKLTELEEQYPDSNIVVYRDRELGSWDVEGFVTVGNTRQKNCAVPTSQEYVDYKWVVFDGAGELVMAGERGFRNWAYTPEGATRISNGDGVRFVPR